MRHLLGSGTPRGLQDRPATVIAALLVLLRAPRRWLVALSASHPLIAAVRCFSVTNHHHRLILSRATTYTTGCYAIARRITTRLTLAALRAAVGPDARRILLGRIAERKRATPAQIAGR
jgi:hypothetical protein